jgi:hypothetical protein
MRLMRVQLSHCSRSRQLCSQVTAHTQVLATRVVVKEEEDWVGGAVAHDAVSACRTHTASWSGGGVADLPHEAPTVPSSAT